MREGQKIWMRGVQKCSARLSLGLRDPEGSHYKILG